MKLCGVDTVAIEPGEIIRWELTATADAAPVAVPPSENEKFHLDAMRRSGTAGWLALTLEFDDAVDLEDLTRRIRSLLDRHEVLRCHFVSTDDDHRRHRLAPGHVAVQQVRDVASSSHDSATLTAVILDGISATCSPTAPLRHYLAAVRRPSSTTVICAFDHCYVDAFSLAVIASDLAGGDADPSVATPVSFLDIRAAEESAPVVDPDDPRLRAWGEFLAANRWTVPEFPLDLGLGPGEATDVHTEIRTLMSARDAERFDAFVRSRSARTYPALLTAVAGAVRDSGGPDELATILPVHTRFNPRDRSAVGWLVGNAPIMIDAGDDGGPTLRTNTDRLGDALPLARIGLTPVYMAYADLLRSHRNDVFMVSYVDYRKLPVPDSVPSRQISSSRHTDAAQFWFWRDADGIHLRARYPRTATAESTMAGVFGALADRLALDGLGRRHHRAG